MIRLQIQKWIGRLKTNEEVVKKKTNEPTGCLKTVKDTRCFKTDKRTGCIKRQIDREFHGRQTNMGILDSQGVSRQQKTNNVSRQAN